MTPEQTAFELRQARAADYLREQHQRRLAEAVRQSDAPASRGWFVLLAALVAVVQLLGLSLSRGVYRVSWRPVPTSATRGCLFPAWVGRPHWPGCER